MLPKSGGIRGPPDGPRENLAGASRTIGDEARVVVPSEPAASAEPDAC